MRLSTTIPPLAVAANCCLTATAFLVEHPSLLLRPKVQSGTIASADHRRIGRT